MAREFGGLDRWLDMPLSRFTLFSAGAMRLTEQQKREEREDDEDASRTTPG